MVVAHSPFAAVALAEVDLLVHVTVAVRVAAELLLHCDGEVSPVVEVEKTLASVERKKPNAFCLQKMPVAIMEKKTHFALEETRNSLLNEA